MFPHDLKNANITPVFKKGDRNSETNYRPVRILLNISKIYERCLYKQMSKFFDKTLSSTSAVSEKVLIPNTLPSNYQASQAQKHKIIREYRTNISQENRQNRTKT